MKEKKIFEILLCTILVLSWMLLVFYFSSENGNLSKSTSGNTIRYIAQKIFSNSTELQIENIVDTLQPIARKIAHFTLYTAGGFFLSSLFNYLLGDENRKRNVLITIVCGAIYALSDELHQLFIDGRGARITDVIIDFCGILFGIIIFFIVQKTIRYFRKMLKKHC